MLIKKECDIEELVNELEKRIKNAEEDEEYNLEFPITKAMEILDILHELAALPVEKCVISSNYERTNKPEYHLLNKPEYRL